MALIYVLCRDYMDRDECSVALGAKTDEELIETAVEHAYTAHAEQDSPALREAIRRNVRRGELAQL